MRGGSPAGDPHLCAAAPPAASGPASPSSWSEPPPADMKEIKETTDRVMGGSLADVQISPCGLARLNLECVSGLSRSVPYRERNIKDKQDIKAIRVEHQRGFLPFRLVLVAASGLADAVLPLPVQDLLQLLLLPAGEHLR